MSESSELTITRDQLRRRRHIVHNVLPPNVTALTPLAQFDAEAVAWFQEKYPDEFKAGVEMRVFDQSFAARAQAKP